jgi:tetratricopeptide (TPR) repeat protein
MGVRMTRLRNQFCILLFLLVSPPQSVSQLSHNSVTLSGMVLSEGRNQRIEHVDVHLCDGGGNLLEQAVTPDSGEFTFRGLQRGRYILTLQASGFQNTQVQVDLSYASDKGMTIYMSPEVKGDSSGPAGPTVSAHELSMPEAARKLMASGQKKIYGDKNFEGGLTDFQQAVAIAPGYYEAHREIGMAYLNMGKADEAQTSFRKAIEVSHDTYGDADVGLGTLLIEKGDVDAGEKKVRRGVELNPNSWMGFYELGKLDLSRDHLDSALQSAQKAKTITPNTPIVYRLLANIHLRQKDYANLLGDLDAYIRLDPSSPAGLRAIEMRKEVAQVAAKQSSSRTRSH